MGNVPLFPPVPDVPPPPPVEVLQGVIRERQPYMCLDPLPEYFQTDNEYFTKLAESKGRVLRSDMTPEPEAKIEPTDEADGGGQDMGEEYSVEAILRKRIHKKQVEYLVKWEDSPEEASTWEPETHLKKYRQMLLEFNRVFNAQRLEMKRKNIPKPGPGRGWNSRRKAAKNARDAKRRKKEEKEAAEAAAAAAAAAAATEQGV